MPHWCIGHQPTHAKPRDITLLPLAVPLIILPISFIFVSYSLLLLGSQFSCARWVLVNVHSSYAISILPQCASYPVHAFFSPLFFSVIVVSIKSILVINLISLLFSLFFLQPVLTPHLKKFPSSFHRSCLESMFPRDKVLCDSGYSYKHLTD